MSRLVIICVCMFYVQFSVISAIKLEEKFVWKEVEYDWPSDQAKDEALNNGSYIVNNNLPLGLERWNDKLFITVPRWKAGVASSLNYVKLSTDETSPKLIPYPNWQAHNMDGLEADKELNDNSTIISPFRVRADECNYLWVMDTGLADIYGEGKQLAAPSIVIFDLKTDELVRRYYFPSSQVKEDTFLANIIIDADSSDCDNTHAYIPDLGSYAVIVYSLKDDKSWRIKHNFFHFDPLQGDFNVGGINFQWTDGVFGMAVGKQQKDFSRPVYFHPFASTKEFAVSNKVLQNETYSQSTDSFYEYKVLGDRGQNSQSSAEFYDANSEVLFYTQVNKDAIGCWDTRSKLSGDTQGLIDSDSETLVFPNDLKVDREGNLWVLSDKLPQFIYKSLDSNEFNYRILKGNVKDLIVGTPCAETIN